MPHTCHDKASLGRTRSHSRTTETVDDLLTTTVDHNGGRRGPNLADVLWRQAQVSDGNRQPGRILQTGVSAWSRRGGISTWSYQVAIDLDHCFAVAEPRAAPKCSSRSAPDRPPAAANGITYRARDLQRPCCHKLRNRWSLGILLIGVPLPCQKQPTMKDNREYSGGSARASELSTRSTGARGDNRIEMRSADPAVLYPSVQRGRRDNLGWRNLGSQGAEHDELY